MITMSEATLDRLLSMSDRGLADETEDDTVAWDAMCELRRELLLLKHGQGEREEAESHG